MKKGQIYEIQLENNYDAPESKTPEFFHGILMHDVKDLEKHPLSSVFIIPIEENTLNKQVKGVELTSTLFEKKLGKGTWVALIDKLRTVDKWSLKKEVIGIITSEGLELIDRAVLKHMGVEIPE